MLISIFIPTYNSSALIDKTLESLLQQTYQNIEILCVDDESKDNTIDILNAYAKKDARIKVFQKKNGGSVPFSWNYIFPYLQGDFTIYMSHDDILEPTAIEKLVFKQQSQDDIDCVIPSLVFFEHDYLHPEKCFEGWNNKGNLGQRSPISGIQAFNEMLDYSIPGFALWRTNLICKIGMPTESFNSDEGMQRIWAKNCRMVAFSDAKFCYRQSANSIVKGLKPYHYFSLATNLRLYKELCSTSEINKARKKQIQYKFFEALFYLSAQYSKHKDQFNKDKQKKLEQIIDESYSLMKIDLKYPLCIKGFVMKLASLNRCIFNLLVKL